jgi:hypothetical protein
VPCRSEWGEEVAVWEIPCQNNKYALKIPQQQVASIAQMHLYNNMIKVKKKIGNRIKSTVKRNQKREKTKNNNNIKTILMYIFQMNN